MHVHHLIGCISVLVVLGATACGGHEEESASAGSGRSAPATDLPPLFGNDTPDAAAELNTEPPDRTLRHGVEGTVSTVIDGDTVHVTVNGWYHIIRVQGINAPECDKAETTTGTGRHLICSSDDEVWGFGSYSALRDEFLDQTVTIDCDRAAGEACPTDPFDRFLAFVESDSSGDMGEFMAGGGHALSYTDFPSTRRARYCAAEDDARANQLGMWSLGTRDEVLEGMNGNTRSWYASRDSLCAAATEE